MIELFEIEGGVTLRGYRTSGSRPGPHVLITAGIHGSEYPGILAARKLRAFRRPILPGQSRSCRSAIQLL